MSIGKDADAERMARKELRRTRCLRRTASDNSARWTDGTAVYQVGRKSVSQSKNAVGSNRGVQTTVEPAANAVRSPEIKPCAWNNGSMFSSRSCDPSCKTAPAL